MRVLKLYIPPKRLLKGEQLPIASTITTVVLQEQGVYYMKNYDETQHWRPLYVGEYK